MFHKSRRDFSQATKPWFMNACVGLLSLIVMHSLWPGSTVLAQESSTTSDSDLLRAIELLDSHDDRECEASERALQSAFKRNPKSQIAACGMAFARFQSEDAQATLQWIRSIPSRETLPKELQITVAKLELCAAIAALQPELAEKRFNGIVNAATNEKIDKNQRQAYAELAAVVIDFLTAAPGRSPIKIETLEKADELLTVTSNASVASVYQSARKKSKTQSANIKEWLEKLGSQSAEQRKSTLAELESILGTRKETLEEFRQSATKATANQKDVHRAYTVGAKKLNVDHTIAASEPPALGHPGAEPRPPTVPVKSSIRVDEYEDKKDSEGKSKRVRRRQSDIDAEKDRKFRRMQEEYNGAKAAYDRNRLIYNDLLSSWQEREQLRRQQLEKRLAGIKESLDRLSSDDNQAETERKSASEDFKAAREKVEEQKRCIRDVSIVDASLKSANSGSAFCLACMSAISIGDEKPELLKAFRTRTASPN